MQQLFNNKNTMKNIFKSLAMMLFGALLLVGCTKELKQQVADLQTQTESLWNEVKTLKSSLEATYVTKAELQTLSASLTQVKAAVDAKADKATVDAAVAGLQAQLDNFATVEAVNALSAKVDAIKNCDCNSAEMAEGIAALETALATYTAKTDETIKSILDEIAKINSEAFFAELVKAIDTKDQAILDQVADLAKQLADVNAAILAATEKAEAALKAAEASAADTIRKEFKDADTALASRISSVESRLSALESKVAGLGSGNSGSSCTCNFQPAINSLTSQYSALNNKVEELYNMFNALSNAPRSVVLVPEVLVNGVPTVEFDVLTYNGGVASAVSHACYFVNPSDATFTADMISVVSHEAVTKASEAALKVVDVVKQAEAGKYSVEFRRVNVDDNMFAIAVESLDALVYSDFAQIANGKETKASELVFNGATVSMTPSKTVKVADHVAVKDFDLEAYELSYAYEVTEGKVTVDENGVVKATPEAEGKNVVAVKLMHGENVVRVAELVVNVDATGTFETAVATVAAEAERVAFEATDVKTWVVNLKNEPNTIELIKQAAKAAYNKDFAAAYEYLGGVPGFVYKNATFTGKGEYTMKVELTKAASIADIDFDKYYEQIQNMVNFSDAFALFADLIRNHPEEVNSVLEVVKALVDKVEVPSTGNILEDLAIQLAVSGAKEVINNMDAGDLADMLENEATYEAIKGAVSLLNNYIDTDVIKNIAEKLVGEIKDRFEQNGGNSGDDNTGDDNTGDDNTGDDNTGDDNTGDDNTGDDNTGDDNTGSDVEIEVDPNYTEAQKAAIENANWDLVSAISKANEDVYAGLQNGPWAELVQAVNVMSATIEKVDVEMLNQIIDNLSAPQLEQVLNVLPQEVKDLLNVIINSDYNDILNKLPVDQFEQIIAQLKGLELPEEVKDIIDQIVNADFSSVLDKLPVSEIKDIINKLPEEIKNVIGNLPLEDLKDLVSNLPNLDTDSIIDNVVDNISKEQIENIIDQLPADTVIDLVNQFTGKDVDMDKINEVLENLTDEQIKDILAEIPEDTLNSLIETVLPNINLGDLLAGLTKSSVDVEAILNALSIEDLKALLNNIPVEDFLANVQIPDVDIEAILAKLPAEVKAALKNISVEDFTVLLEQIPVAQIKAVVSQLSEKAQAVLANVPVEQIKALVEKLSNLDVNFEDVLNQITLDDIKAALNSVTKQDIKDVINMLPEAKAALEGLVEKGYELAMWKAAPAVVTSCESTFVTVE